MRKLNFKMVLAAVLASAALSACAPLMIGGVVSTSLVASDRRTVGSQLEDETIEQRASDRLRQGLGERGHVNITSYNRQVLLSGEVANDQDRKLAEQIVAKVDNVRTIINELGVMGNSSLTQRSSDSLITGKVKAAFVDAKDIFANAYKVVTERGTVYLMGRVTQREANRATEITRSVGGVQKVVRAFEIISEEDLANRLPKAAPASSSNSDKNL